MCHAVTMDTVMLSYKYKLLYTTKCFKHTNKSHAKMMSTHWPMSDVATVWTAHTGKAIILVLKGVLLN